MALWRRLSSPFLTGDTASFRRLSLSLHLVPLSFRTACSRSFSVASSKPAGTRSPRGFMKPRRVSPEMQKFLGSVPEVPRTEAVKQIWAYIKKHNLQDPADKKIIVCDEKLKSIFAGKDRVAFLQIPGLITPHFLK